MIQNSDIKVRLTLNDSAGSPYVIAALNAYEVYIYRENKGEKELLKTYKNTNTGPYAITVYNSAAGKIDIVLNRELTKSAPAGKLYAEVRIRLVAGSEFISSRQNLGGYSEIDTLTTTANSSSLT
jgi:hypothetical protein